jgi:cysteine-rich repeat protein
MKSFAKMPPCGLLLAAAVLVLPATARATWIEGKVFCDDGDSRSDGGDTPLDGVTIEAVSQGSGAAFTDATGDAVPVSPAVRGYYRITLPHTDDTYLVRPRSGLPPGSAVIVPDSGQFTVGIDSGTGDPSNARKTRNFLVAGCDGSATTSTTTPGTGNSSTSSTTPGTGNSSTSTTTPGTGNSSTSTTTPGTGNSSTSTTTRNGGGSTTSTLTTGGSTTTSPADNPPPPNCGDGVVTLDEECDDGNQAGGDGCSAACATEDTSETWSINIRLRGKRPETLDYRTFLPNLPSALLGTAPVHLTLSAGPFHMLDAEIPASAFRVKPKPVLVQPDGRHAKAAGEFGIWRVKLELTPVTGLAVYEAHLRVRGELLPGPFAMLNLTAVIQVGNVVYTATDPIKSNWTGKYLRYIHPVLDD